MAMLGMSKKVYAGQWETGLLDKIRNDTDDRLMILSKLKEATEKNRWVTLSDFWKKEGIVDLDKLLEQLETEAEKKEKEAKDAAEPTQEEADAAKCAEQAIDDSIATYLLAIDDIGLESND